MTQRTILNLLGHFLMVQHMETTGLTHVGRRVLNGATCDDTGLVRLGEVQALEVGVR